MTVFSLECWGWSLFSYSSLLRIAPLLRTFERFSVKLPMRELLFIYFTLAASEVYEDTGYVLSKSAIGTVLSHLENSLTFALDT